MFVNGLKFEVREEAIDMFTDNAPVACPSEPFPAFSNEAAYEDHDVGKGDVEVNDLLSSLGTPDVALRYLRGNGCNS